MDAITMLVLIVTMCATDKTDSCQYGIVRQLYVGEDAQRDCNTKLKEIIIDKTAEGFNTLGSCQPVHLPPKQGRDA